MARGVAMSERKVSRRSLFDAFRGRLEKTEASAAPTGFSLDAFYEGRPKPLDSPAIPRFEIRRDAAVPTTRTGVGPDERAAPAAALPALPAFSGVVRVRQHSCLAWQRSFCSVCVERCPVPGAILVAQGRPRVDPARCTGCGICVAACPAPINGFDIVPHEPCAE